MKRATACALTILLALTLPSAIRASTIASSLPAATDGETDSFGQYLAESSDSAPGYSWLNLGMGHKILGYSALASGVAAMVTGGMIAGDYDHDRTPSSSLRSLHSGSSGAAAGLAVAACATGLLAYGGVFDPGSGINAYNSHIVLGLLATLGFIASMVSAPESEDGEFLAKKDYIGHCRVAQVSGVMMFASVIVIQF